LTPFEEYDIVITCRRQAKVDKIIKAYADNTDKN